MHEKVKIYEMKSINYPKKFLFEMNKNKLTFFCRLR